MNPQDLAILRLLEHSFTSKRAVTLARLVDAPIEAVYQSLVRMYDCGLVRIAREPVTGRVVGWEAA